MGRLVVEAVVFEGGGTMPLVGGARVRLLPVEVVLSFSRCLFELRLDPNEAPNCLNREFMRTASFANNVDEKAD